jgi:hypothetical protein
MKTYYVWGRDTVRPESGRWALVVQCETPDGIEAEVAKGHPNGALAKVVGFREVGVSPALAPPPPPPSNAAAVVAQIGERIWGERNWPAGVARLIGCSPRTLQRLHDAVRDGRDYATAPTILAQVHAKLGDIVASTSTGTNP